MTSDQQQIVEKIMRLLLIQGGDLRPEDFVVDEVTVAELLDEYLALEQPTAMAS